jgi:hypothetical protein
MFEDILGPYVPKSKNVQKTAYLDERDRDDDTPDVPEPIIGNQMQGSWNTGKKAWSTGKVKGVWKT